MFVLHTPLFLLDVPETYCVVQTGSSEPFPVPREARGEYWALIGSSAPGKVDSAAISADLMKAAFEIKLCRNCVDTQCSVIRPH